MSFFIDPIYTVGLDVLCRTTHIEYDMQYSLKKYAHFVRFGVFSCFGNGQFYLYYRQVSNIRRTLVGN